MRRLSRIVTYVCLLVILMFWVSYTMVMRSSEEKLLKISVILTGSENDRWLAVKNGMAQAASDMEVELEFPRVSQHPSTNDEWDIIARELYVNKADAVIVEPIGKELMSGNISGEYEIPIVFIDSDVEPQGVYSCIKVDDEQIGITLADELYKTYGAQLKNKSIGVVCGVYSRLSMNIRYRSFYERLAEHGGRIRWTLGLGNNLERGLDMQLGRSAPDIIVALGNYETETVVDKIMQHGMENDIALYGEGYSAKAVYFLEKGIIDCLVLPNEYMLGYMAVEEATNKAQHLSNKERNTIIELHSIRSDEVFLDNNQKMLFPYIE